MSHLIRAELLRVVSRRLVRWTALAGVAVLVITWVLTLVNAPPSHPGDFVGGVFYAPPGFTFDTSRALDGVYQWVPLLLGVGIMLGSSIVGAEWASRGLTNALVWEPRRVRLLTAKLVAIALVVGAMVLAYLALLLAGIAIVAAMAGSIGTVALGEVAFAAARGTSLCVLVAVLGATTAAVMRSSVASFGIAFGLLVIIQPFIMGQFPSLGKWMFTTNGIAYLLWRPVPIPLSQSEPLHAGLVLALYGAVFIAASMAVFRRQEIG